MLIAVGGFTPIGRVKKYSRRNCSHNYYKHILNLIAMIEKRMGRFHGYIRKNISEFDPELKRIFDSLSASIPREEVSYFIDEYCSGKGNPQNLANPPPYKNHSSKTIFLILFCFLINIIQSPIAYSQLNTILSNYSIPVSSSKTDTTISFADKDFIGSFRIVGYFSKNGFLPDTAAFSRNVEFDLAKPTAFSWFAPFDNPDVSKYDASVSKTGDAYAITFTSKDSLDTYRTIVFEDGKEIGVYTNQSIDISTGLGERSEIASGWFASFSNISEANGKLKMNLSVSRAFKGEGEIGTEGGFKFPLGQLRIFGEYDKSTQKPMNYLEVFTKPSMKVNFGQRNKAGVVFFKDTLLKKVVVVKITNNFKYPENEAKWFASTSFFYSGAKDNEIRGAVYTIGMPNMNTIPVSLMLVDSSDVYPKSAYYRTIQDAKNLPVDVKLRGPPYDSTRNTMLFGSILHTASFKRFFALVRGNDFNDFTSAKVGTPAIGITFGFTSENSPDSLPTLMQSATPQASNGFDLGAIYKKSGNYYVSADQTLQDADFGNNMHIKVLRNDSLVIWDTDVRAQAGATFKLETRSFAYEKQSPTGVNDEPQAQENGLPNPTAGTFNIQFEGKGAQEFFNVYDAKGGIVKSFQTGFVGEGEQGAISADLTGLPAGTYYISRRSEGLSRSQIKKKAMKVMLVK